MTGDEILDAMEHIDPDLIEAADATTVHRKPMWIRYVAIAAVVALVVGLGVWLLPNNSHTDPTVNPTLLWDPTASSTAPTPIPSTHHTTLPTSPTTPTAPPPENLITLSAEDIAAIFEHEIDPSDYTYGTKYYELITCREIAFSPIVHEQYLPIYDSSITSAGEELLRSFIADNYDLITSQGELPPEYTIVTREGSEALGDFLQVNIGSNIRFQFHTRVLCMVNTTYGANNDFSGSILLDGEIVSIGTEDSDLSDENVAEALSGFIDRLNRMTGGDFFIGWNNEWYTYIILYSGDENKGVYPEAVHLLFDPYRDENGDYYYGLSQIEYNKKVDQWQDYHAVTGLSPMITLEEAEILLEKGYTFGHQTCGCGAIISGPEVDFSEYDGVELEWQWGENGQVVPFYSFYKKQSYDAATDKWTYACVHVPAIEVDGLEEYFETFAENHKHRY